MSLISTLLLTYIVANAVLAVPFMVRARREFRRLGKWSPVTAVWSGIVMHGQALATAALAFADRGSLWPVTGLGLVAGAGVLLAGAAIIGAGRLAYGDQRRVYGLVEDRLIETGIYRITRNPQYVGYAAMFFGAAMASGSVLALASAAVFAVTAHIFITRIEEPHLRRVFGPAFEAYCLRTRRYA